MHSGNDLDIMQTLQKCEATVWDALVDGNAEVDSAALHNDFIGVYSDGFASKADHVQQLVNGPTIERYALSEFRLKTLGDDHAILSYRADFLRRGKGQAEAMFVSSVWQRARHRWINVFSQDTPAIDE